MRSDAEPIVPVELGAPALVDVLLQIPLVARDYRVRLGDAAAAFES